MYSHVVKEGTIVASLSENGVVWSLIQPHTQTSTPIPHVMIFDRSSAHEETSCDIETVLHMLSSHNWSSRLQKTRKGLCLHMQRQLHGGGGQHSQFYVPDASLEKNQPLDIEVVHESSAEGFDSIMDRILQLPEGVVTIGATEDDEISIIDIVSFFSNHDESHSLWGEYYQLILNKVKRIFTESNPNINTEWRILASIRNQKVQSIIITSLLLLLPKSRQPSEVLKIMCGSLISIDPKSLPRGLQADILQTLIATLANNQKEGDYLDTLLREVSMAILLLDGCVITKEVCEVIEGNMSRFDSGWLYGSQDFKDLPTQQWQDSFFKSQAHKRLFIQILQQIHSLAKPNKPITTEQRKDTNRVSVYYQVFESQSPSTYYLFETAAHSHSGEVWFQIILNTIQKIQNSIPAALNYLASIEVKTSANEYSFYFIVRYAIELCKSSHTKKQREMVCVFLSECLKFMNSKGWTLGCAFMAEFLNEVTSFDASFQVLLKKEPQVADVVQAPRKGLLKPKSSLPESVHIQRVRILCDADMSQLSTSCIPREASFCLVDSRGDVGESKTLNVWTFLDNILNSKSRVEVAEICGPKGSGKFHIINKWIRDVWARGSTENTIAYYIPLSVDMNLSTDLVQTLLHLGAKRFSGPTSDFKAEDIQAIKKANTKIIFFLDHAHDLQILSRPIYESNRLNEWNIRLVFLRETPAPKGSPWYSFIPSYLGNVPQHVWRLSLGDYSLEELTKAITVHFNPDFPTITSLVKEDHLLALIPEIGPLVLNPFMARLFPDILLEALAKAISFGEESEAYSKLREFALEGFVIQWITQRFQRQSLFDDNLSKISTDSIIRACVFICQSAAKIMIMKGSRAWDWKAQPLPQFNQEEFEGFDIQSQLPYYLRFCPMIITPFRTVSFQFPFLHEFFLNHTFSIDRPMHVNVNSGSGSSLQSRTELLLRDKVKSLLSQMKGIGRKSKSFVECTRLVISNPDAGNYLLSVVFDSRNQGTDAEMAALAISVLCDAKYPLEGMDFSFVQIPGADLSCRDLTGCNFSYANLEGALLIGSNLSRCNFAGANLSNIDTGIVSRYTLTMDTIGSMCTWLSDQTSDRIAVVNQQGKISTYKAISPLHPERSWETMAKVTSLCSTYGFSSEPYIVAGHADGGVSLWNPHTGEKKCHYKPHTKSVTSIESRKLFNGLWLITSCSEAGDLVIYDAMLNERVYHMHDLSNPILLFAPLHTKQKSSWIACGTLTSKVEIWETESSTKVQTLARQYGGVMSLTSVISPRGQDWVLSTFSDWSLQIWDCSVAQCLYMMKNELPPTKAMFCISGLKNEPIIAAVGRDNCVRLWDISHRAVVGHVTLGKEEIVQACPLVSSTQSALIACAMTDRSVSVLDVRQYMKLARAQHCPYAILNTRAFLGPKGQVLAAIQSSPRTLELWDVQAKTRCGISSIGAGRITCILPIPIPDYPVIVAAGDNASKIHFWSLTNNAFFNMLEGHNGDLLGLSLYYEGDQTPRIVSAGTESVIRVWDIYTGSEVFALPPMRATPLHITTYQDKKYGVCLVCALSCKEIFIYSLQHKQAIMTLQVPVSPGFTFQILPFTHTIARIAHTNDRHEIVLCTLDANGLITRLQGHTERVISTLYLEDSETEYFLSASVDGILILWYASDMMQICKIDTNLGGLNHAQTLRLQDESNCVVLSTEKGHLAQYRIKIKRVTDHEAGDDSIVEPAVDYQTIDYTRTGFRVEWTLTSMIGPNSLQIDGAVVDAETNCDQAFRSMVESRKDIREDMLK